MLDLIYIRLIFLLYEGQPHYVFIRILENGSNWDCTVAQNFLHFPTKVSSKETELN